MNQEGLEFSKSSEIFKVDEPWKSSPESPFGVRRFNPSNTDESQAIADIDRHPRGLEFLVTTDPSTGEITQNTPSSPAEIDDFIRSSELDENAHLLLAIVDEENKAIGWVNFYNDNNIEKVKKMYPGIPDDALVLEVSYGKVFSHWPDGAEWVDERTNLKGEERKGVGVVGLEQAMLKVKDMETRLPNPRRIFITAYTVPENIPSEIVLQRNGFTKLQGTVDYEDSGEINNVWIKEII